MKVWSEREPGVWTECTEASALMVADHAGVEFPLGAYTDAERDALDEAIGFDHPGGGNTLADVDAGMLKRYGVKLRPLIDGTREGLRATLNHPGLALTVAGSFGGLSRGHRFRRWQPNFTGGHMVAVETQGNGGVLWLDPLAPMGHEGDKAAVDEVMAFAWTPGQDFVRVARKDEFRQIGRKELGDVDITELYRQDPKIVRIRPGSTLYKRPGGTEVHWVLGSDGKELDGMDAEMLGELDGWWFGRRVDDPQGAFFFADSALDRSVPFRVANYDGDAGSLKHAAISELATLELRARQAKERIEAL